MQPLPRLVLVLHLLPRIKVFKRGRDSTDAGSTGIADAGHGAVFEQFGNIPAVAYSNLRVCSVKGGVLVGGILQLHDAERNAVDEKKHIGNAMRCSLNHVELIDDPKNIFFGMFKINVMQMKRRQAVGWRDVTAVLIKPDGVAEAVIVGSAADVANIGDDGREVIGRQPSGGNVLCGKKIPEIVFQQGFRHFPVQPVPGGIRPAFLLKHIHKRLLEFAFIQLAAVHLSRLLLLRTESMQDKFPCSACRPPPLCALLPQRNDKPRPAPSEQTTAEGEY